MNDESILNHFHQTSPTSRIKWIQCNTILSVTLQWPMTNGHRLTCTIKIPNVFLPSQQYFFIENIEYCSKCCNFPLVCKFCGSKFGHFFPRQILQLFYGIFRICSKSFQVVRCDAMMLFDVMHVIYVEYPCHFSKNNGKKKLFFNKKWRQCRWAFYQMWIESFTPFHKFQIDFLHTHTQKQ